ncbi:MAG: glycosyltransferase, partial [Verrucomicrobia bacterium]|nr:glycosyltransferase [Verrucomicrobiota bacterium]
MPRLLIICHGYPPYYGGAERAAAAIAEQAARSGHDSVHVLTSDIGGRLPAQEERNQVTIHRVHSPKKEWTRHSIGELLAFYLIARRRLKALHAQIQPDA